MTLKWMGLLLVLHVSILGCSNSGAHRGEYLSEHSTKLTEHQLQRRDEVVASLKELIDGGGLTDKLASNHTAELLSADKIFIYVNEITYVFNLDIVKEGRQYIAVKVDTRSGRIKRAAIERYSE